NQVTLKGELPDQKFEDDEILAVAYDILTAEVQPLIVNLREEYYVKHLYHTIVAGQAAYRMPDRALGQKLREVKIKHNGKLRDLPQIGVEDVGSVEIGTPTAFWLESNYLNLYKTPATTEGQLDLSYYLQCSRPVVSTAAAQITNIDTGTGVLTAACPSTWTTSDTFDLTSRKNSGENLAMDLTATSVSGSSVTFAAADLPSGLTLGDFISLAGETFIIPIPDTAHSLLISMVVAELLHAMGSLNEAGVMEGKAERQKAALSALLKGRVTGAPKRFGPMI
ncbi:MAG: hypothetical protein M3Q07_23290, partial [Pseudobdellovibrionaceae bacterium]|nr:hypothetical protein [Pseudobdellovibrionaceae bacterium]